MKHRLLAVTLVAAGISACASKRPAPASYAAGGPASSEGGSEGGDDVQVETVVEKLPDGSTRTTTITHTRRTVEAPPPPPRPADPWPADPLVRYNVDLINQYRAAHGLPPLLYDAKISAFALAGSRELAADHTAHAHFQANIQNLPPGFGTRSAENQGDPRGVPSMDPSPIANGKKQIALLMKIMMDEGPGGGHYENIVSPELRRVGVGILYVGGKLYLTNDFSN